MEPQKPARGLQTPAYELQKTVGFEAAHRLPHVAADHKCARLHGHSFRVKLRVRGALDEGRGWVVDYADVAAAWAPLHEQLDHRYLNEVAGLENPTSEVLAAWIAERFVLAGAQLYAVEVHETCTSACVLFLREQPG